MKNLLKDTIFIIIFIILLHMCSNVLVLKGNGYGSDVISFYNEKKNSLDIIFFGSSHSYATFSPEIIKKETNLKSYNFATQQQPIYITYHYMIEALKYQKPQYFVLETHMLIVDSEYAEEGTTRDAIDKMKFSLNKIKTINASVKNKKDRLSYYINIIKYHSRYSELQKNDIKIGLTGKGLKNKGFIALDAKSDIIVDNQNVLKTEKQQELYSKNLKYFEKIIKLCEKNNIKLILVTSPCLLTEENQQKYNWLKKYVESKNITYINYNEKFDELSLQRGDFFDYGHLSSIGAEKVSNLFCKKIKEKNI